MNKYWDLPPDAEIDTGKNIIRYYKSAGKLQISMPTWIDKDGSEKRGKTVSLNLDSLRETPAAMELVQQIFSDIAV